MADTNNDDVLSVNSDFERIPNTPMERDTDVEDLELDEGQKTPKGFASSEPNIDPVAFDALMKKVDMLAVQMNGISQENSELLVRVDRLGNENSELRTHLLDFQHNKEHEDPEFVLVDNSKDAFWVTSTSHLNVQTFTVKNENRGVSIRSTQGFSTVPFFADSLIYNVNNYEITVDKMPSGGSIHFGFATRDFPMGEWVGKSHHSFAITNDGTLWHLGEETTNFAPGKLSVGDTVSCVIMVGSKTASAEAVNCKRCLEKPSWLFFAKNGKIWGNPIPLPSELSSTIFYPTISLSAGCEVTANFGARQFKYAPSAAGLNCFGGFCHCGQLQNELEKLRVQHESDQSELKDEANKKMAEQEARFELKLDAIQSKHNGELDSVRRGIIVLALATFHGPLEFLKHLNPEFVELLLVNNTENAAWNCVNNELLVSGNSVTKSGSNSYRSIRTKCGFSAESMSSSYNPAKVHLLFHYFEITIDTTRNCLHVGLASEDIPADKWVGNCANSFGIYTTTTAFYQSGASKDNFAPGNFGQGDTIGCGLMVVHTTQKTHWIFFTKNGKIWGTPVALPVDVPSILYPTVSIYQSGDKVIANFGTEPFKYGIPPAEGLLC